MLWISVFPQIEFLHQRFAEVAAASLSEDRVLAEQFVTGLVIRFPFTILADAHIAGGHTYDTTLLVV